MRSWLGSCAYLQSIAVKPALVRVLDSDVVCVHVSRLHFILGLFDRNLDGLRARSAITRGRGRDILCFDGWVWYVSLGHTREKSDQIDTGKGEKAVRSDVNSSA